MAAGHPVIAKARNGARIALVFPTHVIARVELERIAGLAGEADSKIVRTNGRETITFDSGGEITFHTPRPDPRGRNLDLVIVHPDAWSQELADTYGPAFATTGGQLLIEA